MTWNVILTATYESWLDSLPKADQDRLLADLRVLEEAGPQLGRPLVDSIKGSSIPHLKELRRQVGRKRYRSFFAFDERRQAWVLVGGDKSPSFRSDKAKRAWYATMIEQAETVWNNERE